MTNRMSETERHGPRARRLFAALAPLLAAALLAGGASVAHAKKTPCVQTAKKMLSSCKSDLKKEYLASVANCLNYPEAEQGDCVASAKQTRKDEGEGCGAQRDARQNACELLDEFAYDTEPLTDPNLTFVDPGTITTGNGNLNPFFSLESGHTYVLRAGEGFEETVVVHVTDETREILGQPCRVVVDAVLLVEEDMGSFEYEAVEITDDLYAQDTNEDIYYCGEVSRNYEGGTLRDLQGSFEAGFPPDEIDKAKSGILLKADPMVGDAHRQEFFLGEAEDLTTYLDTAADVPVEEGGAGTLPVAFQCSANCLKTQEFIPPEPDAGEFKYYRSGIGFVLGVALEDGVPTGERDELVCVGDSLAVLQTPDCDIGDPAGLLDALCELSTAFCR